VSNRPSERPAIRGGGGGGAAAAKAGCPISKVLKLEIGLELTIMA